VRPRRPAADSSRSPCPGARTASPQELAGGKDFEAWAATRREEARRELQSMEEEAQTQAAAKARRGGP
jgi:hypothetical protein